MRLAGLAAEVHTVTLLRTLLGTVAADGYVGVVAVVQVVVVGARAVVGATHEGDETAYGHESKYKVSVRHLPPTLLQSMIISSHKGLVEGRRVHHRNNHHLFHDHRADDDVPQYVNTAVRLHQARVLLIADN